MARRRQKPTDKTSTVLQQERAAQRKQQEIWMRDLDNHHRKTSHRSSNRQSEKDYDYFGAIGKEYNKWVNS